MFSMLWTDQPQPWAAVPAGLTALAGASLLIFAPDANAFNALGGVWPPVLIALAIWMAVQARRHLRSLTRRLMLSSQSPPWEVATKRSKNRSTGASPECPAS